MTSPGRWAAPLFAAALLLGLSLLAAAVRPWERAVFTGVLLAASCLAAATGRRPPRLLLAAAFAPLLAAVLSVAAAPAPLLAIGPCALLLCGAVWAAGAAALDDDGGRRLDEALAAAPAVLALPVLWEFARNVAAMGPPGQAMQVEGWVRNANVLAVASAATVPFAAAFERSDRRPALRAAAAASAVLGVVAVLLSGSRTGLLALTAAAAVGLAGLSRPNRRLVLAGAAVAAALLAAAASPRLVRSLDPSFITNVQRLRMIEDARAAFAERPVLGWGPGAAPFVYPRFQRADKWELHYHALPLQAAVETGLVGVLAWGAAVAILGFFIARNRRTPAAASVAALLAASATDYLLWIPLVSGLLWVAAGRLAGASAAPAATAGAGSLGRRVFPAAAPAALAAAAAFTVTIAAPLVEAAPDLVEEASARADSAAAARALARNPLDAGARNAAAGLTFARGDIAAAEILYREALAADPWADFGPHHLDLALLLVRDGRETEAAPFVAAAAQRHPNLARWFVESVLDTAARAAVGTPVYAEGDRVLTQDLLYGTVDLYPDSSSPEAWTFEEIEDAVTRGDPLSWRLRRSLGGRLLAAGDAARALVQIRRAEYLRYRQTRPDPTLLDRLAAAAAAAGDGALAGRARSAAAAADRAVWPYAEVASLAYNRPDLARRSLRVSAWPHPGTRPRPPA